MLSALVHPRPKIHSTSRQPQDLLQVAHQLSTSLRHSRLEPLRLPVMVDSRLGLNQLHLHQVET